MSRFSLSEFIVDLKQFKINVKIVKSLCRPNVKFCLMVKADGYGHGASQVSNYVKDIVDVFGVANIDEGIELRKTGIKNEIIVMSPIGVQNYVMFSKYKLGISLGSFSEVDKLSTECKRPVFVHFQVNSGMNRFGFCEKSELLRSILRLNENKKLRLKSIYSHFATKENNVDYILKQKLFFDNITNSINSNEIQKHISNSNCIFFHPEVNYDMVRTGYACYGYMENSFGIKPILKIKSKILSLHYANCGEFVGYDCTCILTRKTLIATIPLGYADGIDRRLSNVGYFYVNGKKAKILGNVCMDCTIIDVTDVDAVALGDEVTILGNDKFGNVLELNTYAEILNTSPYEILLKFHNGRMNKIYLT